MAKQMLKLCTVLALLTAPLLAGPASAQTPSVRVTSNIMPIQPRFTRPAGMPGASRQITVTKELYMRAVPFEIEQPVVKPRKKHRRH